MATRLAIPWLLVLGAGLARALPHLANLTPVGGLGLYAGARVRTPAALLTPILAVLVGDLVAGTWAGPIVAAGVYVGLLGGPVAGRWLLGRQVAPGRFAAAVIVAAAWFFLTSNFAMWLSGIGAYPLTPAGLAGCYLAGLPYLARSMVADASFAALLFAAEGLARRTLPAAAGEPAN
jgi:hypothetical protein